MMLLASLVTCWIEKAHVQLSDCSSRAYAGDLSVVTEADTQQEVIRLLNRGYINTQKFTKLAGMKINMNKTFTFGNKMFKYSIKLLFVWLVAVSKPLTHVRGHRLKNSDLKIGSKQSNVCVFFQ